jgi:hypothetical protein
VISAGRLPQGEDEKSVLLRRASQGAVSRRSLGEQAVISEPTNLQYLREEAEAVFGRIIRGPLL